MKMEKELKENMKVDYTKELERFLREHYGRPKPKRPTITIMGSNNFIKEIEKYL